AVESEARGLSHAPIVPRRFRIPLIGEIEPEHGGRLFRSDELEARRALNVFGDGTAKQVDDVDLAFLQRGRTRRLFGQTSVDETLDVRRLSPVTLERFHHELDARREA